MRDLSEAALHRAIARFLHVDEHQSLAFKPQVQAFQRHLLRWALEYSNGNITHAARLLNLNRTTFYVLARATGVLVKIASKAGVVLSRHPDGVSWIQGKPRTREIRKAREDAARKPIRRQAISS